MQNTFSNALSKAVSQHIELSPTRHQTLAWLAWLIMQHGTICLWRLAAYVATQAQTDSVRRRLYRFFQHVRLDGAMTARVVVDLLGLGGKPWVLAMDRTNWDFGKTTINILIILGDLERHGHSVDLDAAADGGELRHGNPDVSFGSSVRGLPRPEDRSIDGRPRVYRRRLDGVSATSENPFYSAVAREPARGPRRL